MVGKIVATPPVSADLYVPILRACVSDIGVRNPFAGHRAAPEFGILTLRDDAGGMTEAPLVRASTLAAVTYT
jgi:hypothetical protein